MQKAINIRPLTIDSGTKTSIMFAEFTTTKVDFEKAIVSHFVRTGKKKIKIAIGDIDDSDFSEFELFETVENFVNGNWEITQKSNIDEFNEFVEEAFQET